MGGGNLADESVVNVLAEIEAQGEMNALTRMWEGEVEAQSDEVSAVIARNQGRAAGGAGILAGIGSSFAGKYG